MQPTELLLHTPDLFVGSWEFQATCYDLRFCVNLSQYLNVSSDLNLGV